MNPVFFGSPGIHSERVCCLSRQQKHNPTGRKRESIKWKVNSTYQHSLFFIKDRVASGEVKIEHCPTKDMVGNFFTKPLQGAQFTKFRDEIMNVNPTTSTDESQDCRSVLNNIVSEMTGHSERTSGHETDSRWKMVESKQDIMEKRMRSRMSTGKTEGVSRVNGKPNCKRVRFRNKIGRAHV